MRITQKKIEILKMDLQREIQGFLEKFDQKSPPLQSKWPRSTTPARTEWYIRAGIVREFPKLKIAFKKKINSVLLIHHKKYFPQLYL